MERDKSINKTDEKTRLKRRRAASKAAALLVAGVLVAGPESQIIDAAGVPIVKVLDDQSSTPSVLSDGMQGFNHDSREASNVIFDNSPGPGFMDEFKPLSPQSSPATSIPSNQFTEKLIKLNSDVRLEEIVAAIDSAPQILHAVTNEQLLKDVKIYYPIIEPIAQYYGIPWEVLMVTIEQESHASRSKKAFSKENYPIYGIAQINIDTWTPEYIKKASEPFSDLAGMPQRHQDDWEMIAAAAKMISDNYVLYRDRGLSDYESMLNSLSIYTGDEYLAKGRLQEILKMEKMSSSQNQNAGG